MFPPFSRLSPRQMDDAMSLILNRYYGATPTISQGHLTAPVAVEFFSVPGEEPWETGKKTQLLLEEVGDRDTPPAIVLPGAPAGGASRP